MKLCLVISLIICQLPLIGCAAEIFKSIDDKGNTVFSDKPPVDREFDTISSKEVKTVKWESVILSKVSSATTKSRKKTTKQNKNTRSDSKKSLCASLNASIKRKETLLNSRLKAEDFDRIKSELSDARLKHRKYCS